MSFVSRCISYLNVAGVIAEMDLRRFQIGDLPAAEEETIHRNVRDSMLLVIAREGGGGHTVGVDADVAECDVVDIAATIESARVLRVLLYIETDGLGHVGAVRIYNIRGLVVFLQGGRLDDGIIFDADVLKKDIMHPAVIHIHDVDGGTRQVNCITVSEYNPAQVIGACFSANLEGFPPVVPNDAILKRISSQVL